MRGALVTSRARQASVPRILLISNIPTPYNDALFREIASRAGVELHVAYCAASERNRSWRLGATKGYDYAVLRGITLGRAGHLNPGVIGWLWKHRPDLVVMSGSYAMPTAQLAIASLRRRGTPWLYWGEELRHDALSPPIEALRSLLRRPLQHAEGILAIGRRAIQSYQREGIDPDRIANFHYYADTAPFTDAGQNRAAARERLCRTYDVDPASVIFLFVGQLIARKGMDTLMDAHAIVRREGIKSVLVIAGDGPQQDAVRASANSLDGGQTVRFAGFVQPPQLPALFAGSDCFVLPSRSEGWGVVVPESMAAGTPVISSDQVNAGVDLIDNEESGFLFRAGDAADLARAMRRVAENASHREIMARKGRVAVEQESPVSAATRFLSIVEGVLRGERIGRMRVVA